jgi:hypothetical protein
MFALKPSSLNQRNLVELLSENEPYHRHGKLLKLDRLAKNTADLSLIFELAGNQLAAFFIQEKARGRISDAVNERQLADFAWPWHRVRCYWERSRGTVNLSRQHFARLSRTSRPTV